MTASVYHLYVEPGAVLGFTATVTNPDGSVFDLSGYTLTAQARTPEGSLIFDMGDYLTNGDSTGVITANIPGTVTALVLGVQGTDTMIGSWDLYATNGSTVYRLLQGQVHVIGRVTR